MPGIPNKANNQVALPVENVEVAPQQPRQPESLQGLLRFAMEAQNAPGASNQRNVHQMSEETKRFLENAIKSMTIDIIALMTSQITILREPADDVHDVDEKCSAFENILAYIDNIDIANDFYKITGFSVFEPSFNHKSHEIRAYACALLAELAQNNPYLQNVICESTNYTAQLIKMVENDPDVDVQVKALYAISCITRDCEIGYKNFCHHDGLRVCKEVVQRKNDKLRTKIAFLLTALCKLDTNLINVLIDMEYLGILVKLISEEHNSSHEHILSLMCFIVENKNDIKVELVKDEYHLKQIIDTHLDLVRNKEEFKEEQIYCERILQLVFT